MLLLERASEVKDARSRGTRLGQGEHPPAPAERHRHGEPDGPGRAGQGRAGQPRTALLEENPSAAGAAPALPGSPCPLWPARAPDTGRAGQAASRTLGGAALSADTGTARASLRSFILSTTFIHRAPWAVTRGGELGELLPTLPQSCGRALGMAQGRTRQAGSPVTAGTLFLLPLCYLPPSAKTELVRCHEWLLWAVSSRCRAAPMPAGCREQRAAGQAAGRPSHRPGWAQPVWQPLCRPGLCARSIPAPQLPAPLGPDCRAPRRGARHFFTPTCALHLLTAPEPMEMHQKLLSNELILVQSCYQSFLLFCLSQPLVSGAAVSPSLPGLPHQPSRAPAQQPHGEPLWVQEPSGPPAPGEVSQDTSIGTRGGFKSLQQCRAVSTGVGIAWTFCVCWLCGVQGDPLCCAQFPPHQSHVVAHPEGTRGGEHSQMPSSPRRWCRWVGVGFAGTPPG